MAPSTSALAGAGGLVEDPGILDQQVHRAADVFGDPDALIVNRALPSIRP